MSWKSKCYRGICLLLTVSFISFLVSCSFTDFSSRRINLWDDETPHLVLMSKDTIKTTSSARTPLGNADSHYRLANYYQERDKHKDAIAEFKKIMVIDPKHIKAYNGMGVSFHKLGYAYRAIDYFKKALDLNPNLDYVLNNLGYAYIDLGRYDQAVDALKKAVELNNGNKRFHYNLGLAYVKKGQLDLAFNEFITAGDYAKAHYNLGQAYFEKGLYKEAKEQFQQALNVNPLFLLAGIWLQMADSMTTSGQLSAENEAVDESADVSRKVYEGDVKKVNQLADEKKVLPSDTTDKAQDSENLELINQTRSFDGIGIEISNGNGVNGMARKVGNYLSDRGFDIVRLTNAENFNQTETSIYFRSEYKKVAAELAKQIPGSHNINQVKKLGKENVNIKVLIGKDIIKFHDVFAGG